MLRRSDGAGAGHMWVNYIAAPLRSGAAETGQGRWQYGLKMMGTNVRLSADLTEKNVLNCD